MMYLNQPLLDQQFHYIVAFDGRLDDDRLRQAIRLAMDAEPVFGCRYVAGRRPRWERRSDLDSLALCEVVQSSSVLDVMTEFMAQPCDAAFDPLIRARIVRGTSDTLCLKINHAASDGAGGKELLGVVSSLYRRLLDEPGYRATPNLGSRSRMQLFREYGWKKCLQALRNGAGRPRENQWRFPTAQRADRGAVKFAMRRLDAQDFDALHRYARQFSATLNDVFLSAYFRALWKFLDAPTGRPQTIILPMNARRYLSSGKTEAICNFIAPLFLSLERVPGEIFEVTLRRVAERTRDAEPWRQKALASAFWISVASRVALPRMQQAFETAYQKGVESGLTTAYLSNNGSLEPEQVEFGLPVTDAYQNLVTAFAPALFLAVISFRKCLTFTVSYCSRAMKGEDVEGFLDAFVAELPAGADAKQPIASEQAVR
jgi:NRPS condensation-like uncharacterized protein